MRVLSLLGATLTLPGIAGIVLIIGIAVDANVLINERIREEIRAGKSPFAAVEAGYTRALTTIINSNVTTLISTLVLFWLGSGPVRGFAMTLTVGIIASMFTAITVTRMMVAYWLRWACGRNSFRSRKSLRCSRAFHFIPPDTKIDFVGLRTITLDRVRAR